MNATLSLLSLNLRHYFPFINPIVHRVRYLVVFPEISAPNPSINLASPIHRVRSSFTRFCRHVTYDHDTE